MAPSQAKLWGVGDWHSSPFVFLVNHHPSIPTVRTVRGDASHSSGRRPRNWAWGSAINHSPTSGHRSHQQVVDFCVPWAFPLVFLWGFPGFPSVFQFVLCFVKFFGSRGLHQGIAVCVHVFADLEGPAVPLEDVGHSTTAVVLVDTGF